LLVLTGLWGLGSALIGVSRGGDRLAPWRAVRGLAFLSLVIGANWSSLVGLALVAGSGCAQGWPPLARPREVATPRTEPAPDDRRADLLSYVAELVAEPARLVEERYDLAIGLLVTLAALFAFDG
jgi:hypothetical protein